MQSLERRGDGTARAGIDAEAVAAHLAGAIQLPTVSARGGIAGTAFVELHDYLARTYPRVHAQLIRETVGDSLLYEWQGKSAAMPPMVLMAHLDVVPVDPGTESSWAHPPYAGTVDAGFLYGRGALDDKSAVIAILEAVEKLLGDGEQPARTVYLAFGADEEIGGERGAHQIVERLRARGVEPAMVLDEGGAIMDGQMFGTAGLAAMVGIAEKGYLSLELSVRGAGGHSSTPTTPTNIGRLCRAVAKLEAHPFPARLGGATLEMLRAIAPTQSFGRRLALAHVSAIRPLLVRQFLADPKMATLVQTTTAPTIFHAGDKENVLPKEATAVVNFQILTGETTRSVQERVVAVISDPAVNVRPLAGIRSEPSPVSDVTGAAFATLAKSARQMLGDTAPQLVIPFLTGPTDSRYWASAGVKNVFRFTPFVYEADWMARAHGTNERIGVGGLAAGVSFYVQLIRNAAEL